MSRLIALVIGLALAAAALAAVPQTIPYQGRLTDVGGNPVPDGPYLVQFRIYDSPIAGATLWNSNFRQINVSDGLFSYNLGDTVPLPHNLFTDTVRWLGIKVGVDSELTPRTRLSGSAYAYHALRADTAASVLGMPGVASSFSGSPYLTPAAVTFDTLVISVPSAGYLKVDVTGYFDILHTQGTGARIPRVCVSDAPLIVGGLNFILCRIQSNQPSGEYYVPFAISFVKGVAAPGVDTLFLTADDFASSGSSILFHVHFTAAFFPTAYGSVDASKSAAVDFEASLSPNGSDLPPPTVYDISDEIRATQNEAAKKPRR